MEEVLEEEKWRSKVVDKISGQTEKCRRTDSSKMMAESSDGAGQSEEDEV